MMRMDLEEATCKAVSGFKPFFSPSSLDNSSTGLLNKKIKIDTDTLIKLFTFSQLTETKVPNSNILINNLVHLYIDLFQIRTELQAAMNMDLSEHKSYIDQEMMRILGQMDSPTLIKDYLYLGSEWNASNMDELTNNG